MEVTSILNQSWRQRAQKLSDAWKRLRQGKNEPPSPASVLKGAPATVRTKTYSAETGFVYQYVYRGYHQAEGGRQYVFFTKRDRKNDGAVTIQLMDCEFKECSRIAGRELLDAERYAVAKMTLFEAFDEADAKENNFVVTPDAEAMARHLRTLGRIS